MNQDINKKVATFIRNKRIALGISQTEFSMKVFQDEKKQQWISQIENGRGITVDTLGRILHALNCDIELIEY